MKIDLFVPCVVFTTNAERRMHHHARAKMVKPIREAARIVTLHRIRQERLTKFEVAVRVEFFPFQAQGGGVLADTCAHHPAAKAALDGIVDAGLLHNDTPEWVEFQGFWPPVRAYTTGMGVRIIVPGPLPSAT